MAIASCVVLRSVLLSISCAHVAAWLPALHSHLTVAQVPQHFSSHFSRPCSRSAALCVASIEQTKGDRGQLERRHFAQHCGIVLAGILFSRPLPSSATVSWPGADEGRVKVTGRSQGAVVTKVSSSPPPDGRKQLAQSEIDLSSVSFADLQSGEAGVREGVRRLVS